MISTVLNHNGPIKPMLLKGGHLIDPVNRVDDLSDLLVVDGKVAGVGEISEADLPEKCETEGVVCTHHLHLCLGERSRRIIDRRGALLAALGE